jgi:arginyl-tRNA synthetase
MAEHQFSVDDLASILKTVGISEVPTAPNTYPDLNPFDVYRSHIAHLISTYIDADRSVIQGALQWTNSLDKGDLAMAAPALRIKGKKPDALAQEIVEKVKNDDCILLNRCNAHAHIHIVPRVASC